MLLAQSVQSVHMKDEDMTEFYQHARRVSRERRQTKPADRKSHVSEPKTYLWPFSSTLSRTPIRRKSSTRSVFVTSNPTSPPLRLADVAKQHVMATHVDNWREDMVAVRQHLPMQHIIGSLKRDRDEPWPVPTARNEPSPPSSTEDDTCRPSDLDASSQGSGPATPASVADSFLELLRTPKSVAFSPDPDFDRRFSYQAPEHVAKDIPQSALPGLNMALNLATITAEERDLFSGYAPKQLDDPHLLMDEVRRMRDLMMSKTSTEEPIEEDSEVEHTAVEFDVVRDEGDVTKDFDAFVDY